MMICTHDGVFHSDDVFAGALLRLIYPDVAIVRTRDAETIARATIAFDVGGGRYDHHQPGGNGARPNSVPYASFGLLWRDYGSALVDDAVAEEVDRQLVQPIDAHDNGFPISAPLIDGIAPLTVSHLISNFNPSWDEPQDFDARYAEAFAFATGILERCIVRARGVVLARGIIADAITAADDPRIVVLDRFVPWQDALCAQSADALYIVYPSAGTWRVQVVPAQSGQPGARQSLPAGWAGLEGDALATLTGIDDATFAHRMRFIAGARSKAGALALARVALEDVQ